MPAYHSSFVILGLNSSVVGSLTPGVLLRWMNMIVSFADVEIKRVDLVRFGPFQYCPLPLGDSLPDSEPLGAGDYGCYHRGKLL